MLFALACALALAAPACAAPRTSIDIRQVADAAPDGTSALSIRIAANASAAPVPYYVPLDGPSYTARLSGPSATIGDGFGLATVVDEGADASFAGISKLLASYAGQDDVYNDAFAGALIFSSAAKPKVSSSTVKALAGAYGTDLVFSTSGGVSATGGVKSATVTFSKTVPIGPYVYRVDQAAHTATLWPVYRLYPDPQEAFLYGVTPSAKGGYVRAAGATPDAGDYTSVPVPSRLYSHGSTLPLAGLRVAVKDIYDIAGLKTGCGSRAYFALYPPRNATAPAVQRLIDQGAVVVGKTKTSQFANGETATADWVDQLCPFNPRGDGYQDPSSSSSGSGAAMGAYGWLDHAIGSDTGGSIRGPAGQQGLFGIRPSHGAITLQDVMPLSDVMDTAGYFARDAASFANFGKAWYGGEFGAYSAFPKVVRVPNDTWPLTGPAQAVFAQFIGGLTKFLNASTDATAITDLFTATAGVNASAQVYMNQTYPTLIGAYQYNNFAAPFMADYAAAHGGRAPFIDPAPRVRWAFATGRGAAAFAEEGRRRELFANWTAAHVFKADAASCSDSLLVYPQSTGRTSYRDQYFSPPSAPTGFSYSRVGPYAGVPDLVVPVGQVPYNSTITGKQEWLPVTISLVARKGCDYMVLDLIEKLAATGVVKGVEVGTTAFAG